MKRVAMVLFITAALAALFGFMQLGIHQRHVAEQVGAIIKADKAGEVIAGTENDLVAYTRSHMKTSTRYVLEGSYARAVESAQAAANPASNGQVYAAAQTACAGRADSVAQARCVQTYLATHATPAANPSAVSLPEKGDYTKSVSSPGWTPDSAGLALLVTVAAFVLAAYLMLLSLTKKASY